MIMPELLDALAEARPGEAIDIYEHFVPDLIDKQLIRSGSLFKLPSQSENHDLVGSYSLLSLKPFLFANITSLYLRLSLRS